MDTHLLIISLITIIIINITPTLPQNYPNITPTTILILPQENKYSDQNASAAEVVVNKTDESRFKVDDTSDVS